MNTILIEPVPPKQVHIRDWLIENIGPLDDLYHKSRISGMGWNFQWYDEARTMWAVDIDDDDKAVEFKLIWL